MNEKEKRQTSAMFFWDWKWLYFLKTKWGKVKVTL